MQYKIDRAERETDHFKEEFEKYNETTMRDLNSMCESFEPYFEISLAAFVKSTQTYLEANKKCCQNILDQVDTATSENDLSNRIDAAYKELSELSIVAK